ncbi:MAG: IclR family transcriptional regulator C-terminal domain-containing protein, partial [Comamonas sp.]
SISAAVHGVRRAVLGSVCVSGPVDRLTPAQLESFGPVITQTAAQISWQLGGVSVAALRSTWHPN